MISGRLILSCTGSMLLTTEGRLSYTAGPGHLQEDSEHVSTGKLLSVEKIRPGFELC